MLDFHGSSTFEPETLNRNSPTEIPPSTIPPGVFYAGMSENEPPIDSVPLIVTPLAAMCPPYFSGSYPRQFSSILEEFEAEQEGIRRMAEKVKEAEQKKAKPSKAIDRDGVKGQWSPCFPDAKDMKTLVEEGFLNPDNFQFTEGEASPAPPPGYVVMCKAWVERGLSLPASEFFLDVLEKYKLQPHNICPNSFTILANFQTLMEGHLGMKPDIKLFQWFFRVKPQKDQEKIFATAEVLLSFSGHVATI
jgi:hypothetical protein